MRIYTPVSHVDKLNLIAPPFSSASAGVAGPYSVAAREVFLAGATEAEIFPAGTEAAITQDQ